MTSYLVAIATDSIGSCAKLFSPTLYVRGLSLVKEINIPAIQTFA